jgi:rod shape-determining protein MreD
MIARTLMLTLVLLTAAVIETAIIPFLPIRGLEVNLILLIVLAIALHDGAQPGVRVGFAGGLVVDLLVAQAPVGSATLVLTAIGGMVGTARPYLSAASVTAPLILAFSTAVLATAAYGSMSLVLGEERVTWEAVASASLRVGLFNTLLAPAALAGVRRLSARFPVSAAVTDD